MNLQGAKIFCSIQPCIRLAEGDIVIEQDEHVRRIPVCPRHYEYFVAYFGGEDFDPVILGKETVFVDDVGEKLAEQVKRDGFVHEIIY